MIVCVMAQQMFAFTVSSKAAHGWGLKTSYTVLLYLSFN